MIRRYSEAYIFIAIIVSAASLLFDHSAAFAPLRSFQKSAKRSCFFSQRQSTANLLSAEKDCILEDSIDLDNHKSRTVASFALPVAIACSLASPASALDPNTFTNDYADPLHPQCKRRIQVSVDGKSFHFSGTSVNQPKDDPVLRGCTKEEVTAFGLRKGSFDGIIFDDDKISAGDGIHEGIWEPAGAASTNLGYGDVDGIRWNDGNKWVVKEKSVATQVGEFITFSYIGFSLLAGVIGINNMYQKKRTEES